MPTSQQIAEWKKEFKKIFSIVIGAEEIIFRPLKFSEFQMILAINDPLEAEESIIRIALLSPGDYDFDGALPGTVTSLASEIMERSAFSSIDTANSILMKTRDDTQQVFSMMKTFIITAMPTYRIEELERLSFYELADLLVLAEEIIKLKQIINQAEIGTLQINIPDPDNAPNEDPIAAKLHAALG